ncbi:MAG: 2-oxo acid dehydrogenase subunit E2 [Amoebophilaceae bacterium]|nr:2-oxo acid dehydrogenase subunit E2 [Amoebophilaceae bacterium]
MSIITLYLPKMGESVLEATVIHWLVEEGKYVTEGAPLLEIATDKVDAEVPVPHTGIISKLLVNKGEVVAIGSPIALLETDQVSTQDTMHLKPLIDEADQPHSIGTVEGKTQLLLSPLVRNMMQKNGIQLEELEKLATDGKDNRITKQLLLAYLKKRKTTKDLHTCDSQPFSKKVTLLEGDQVITMDRVRKLIAHRMVESKRIAPHVTSFIRADVTDLVTWRNQVKEAFKDKYRINLTYFTIFMAATARALQAFPLLNAIVVEDKIILKKSIHIGFAVALTDGNLVVPVVKQVESLTLVALAQQMDGLIKKAHSGTLTADDLSGGSYTISNIGSFDNLMGTPIIVQPQVAILAIGAIERRPAVVQVEGKETIAIRDEMFLSHTYDHRIIDGAIGGNFLKYLAKAFNTSVFEDYYT